MKVSLDITASLHVHVRTTLVPWPMLASISRQCPHLSGSLTDVGDEGFAGHHGFTACPRPNLSVPWPILRMKMLLNVHVHISPVHHPTLGMKASLDVTISLHVHVLISLVLWPMLEMKLSLHVHTLMTYSLDFSLPSPPFPPPPTFLLSQNISSTHAENHTGCKQRVCVHSRALYWVQCSICSGWYHCVCAGTTRKKASERGYVFTCSTCTVDA